MVASILLVTAIVLLLVFISIYSYVAVLLRKVEKELKDIVEDLDVY